MERTEDSAQGSIGAAAVEAKGGVVDAEEGGEKPRAAVVETVRTSRETAGEQRRASTVQERVRGAAEDDGQESAEGTDEENAGGVWEESRSVSAGEEDGNGGGKIKIIGVA